VKIVLETVSYDVRECYRFKITSDNIDNIFVENPNENKAWKFEFIIAAADIGIFSLKECTIAGGLNTAMWEPIRADRNALLVP
jgi:hypothetical protein